MVGITFLVRLKEHLNSANMEYKEDQDNDLDQEQDETKRSGIFDYSYEKS